MHTLSLTAIQQALRDKQFSVTELTQYFLKRIQQHNPTLNALITTTETWALQQAEQAQQQLQQNQAKPLTGIPLLHKDIFCTQGIKTSCGSKMLDNFIAPYNATVVDKLHHAGTIMLGKTNMDEFAMGASNENSYYGPVLNPWDNTRVPGGSSGGSAAAVAARLAPAATSTDTGGSIRQPASFCGITGLKPTYGRISRFGMVAFASSLDQGGPMASSAEDCALLLEHMAGHDANDSTSVDHPVPRYTQTLSESLENFSIGVPTAFFEHPLSSEIATHLETQIKILESLGARLQPIELPHAHLAIPAYYIIAPAECSSNLARYDGVRYGYRCQNPVDLEDFYCRNRGESFGDEVKRRILMGTYVLSSGYYQSYYLKAQKIRNLIAMDYQQAFETVDAIVAPTTSDTAFKLKEKSADPLKMYAADYYTSSVNLAGLPALSMPAGFINQLPIGLQLIGNYFEEERLLRIAHQYQQRTDWHTQIPQPFSN